MGLNLSEVECIAFSHGYHDHFGGLLHILRVANKDNLPIIVHKDMFKNRGVAEADGTIRKLPTFPKKDQVRPAKYVATTQPYLIADGMMLVTGEIPRRTHFEKAFTQQRVFVKGNGSLTHGFGMTEH